MSELSCDVLIVGGGLAGTWAAVGAAREGANVILVDKGYCGTSGVTATAGPGHWWVPPGAREAAIEKRLGTAYGLADARWMARAIDTTWTSLPGLSDYYDFPQNEQGETQYRGLRGPEYLRGLRRRVLDSGVTILDHHPALELLRDDNGSVVGARGWRRQAGGDWLIRAGAVVLATGGCAFLSRLLGNHTNTGDGYLMAAEAGAELSGMEFSNYYCIAAAGSSMTRSMVYSFGEYFDAADRPLAIATGPGFTENLAKALLNGPVYCRLNRVPTEIRVQLPSIQPNLMLPFDRRGIDPYRERFAVTLHPEGTIRGVGGLRLVNDDCQTTVPGVFAAGDAASREPIAGATSGGGAQNSAWALSTGQWAGRGAARLARQKAAYHGALRGFEGASYQGRDGLIQRIQAEVHPLDKNLFRSGDQLERSLRELDNIWDQVRATKPLPDSNPLRARETAAMAATARWCYTAAALRKESRGMHQRSDTPAQSPLYDAHLRVSGVDQVQARFDPVSQGQLQCSN
ncbi:FAD-dependent oxidoreductase [Pseudomonas costantinii]|uniref:Oxidoreductase n=1 Tax=Pseudomonas costantinii TaxID=168469 RepID=A0A1S2ULS8_9PSED|nr:FAD-binding protein [Pseudomonas costantinii]NVZ21433.1 FAD-binding protein [Pseudomonas costantinii]OIN47391.1 oxidoreductase [Pseudomonas costantinii]SEE47441.1 Succinate dehydrogenase/fumarate reductase, flavoprotein subunit [Pseudomonas costantinii]